MPKIPDYSDLIGKRSGKLLIIEYLGMKMRPNGKRHSCYLCLCDCGNYVEVPRSQLITGHKVSCGNCRRIEKVEDGFRYYTRNGSYFEFDEEDYDIVASHTWNLNNFGYACTKIDGIVYVLSRLIMNPTGSLQVDHIDGNPKNNRRSNLRFATSRQNIGNTRIKDANTTGYKGVSYFWRRSKYVAKIVVNYKQKHLGYFDTPEEAARAYDEAARFYFGEFACVNFPMEGEQGCRRTVS